MFPRFAPIVLLEIVVLKMKMAEEHRYVDTDRRKPKYSEGSMTTATVCVITTTQTALGSNPIIHVANPEINHLEELTEIRQNYVQ